MSATQRYREARDLLISLRGRHEEALEQFAWPDVGEQFSFDAMAARSDRVGRWLLDRGVGRGDPVLLMLGNQVQLWDVMLAVTKIGAVIVPTATAAGTADLADRVARSAARAVVTTPDQTAKFTDLGADLVRVSVGPADGWADLHDAYAADVEPLPHPGTAPGDPLLLYFTSGTTARPKLVEHTQVSYPVGHLSTTYWLGLRPGDRHLNLSSPGWAKHAWSCFFAPWIAESTIVVLSYARFDAGLLLDVLRDHEVTSFCAPPTVWRMLINADLSGGPGLLREVVGAGEPLNPEVIEQVRRAWGLDLRDGYGQTEMTAAVGNTPGSPLKPGSMGRPLPGVPVVLVDPLTNERVDGVGEGELCLDLGAHPLPLMTGYQGDSARNEEGWITYVGRTDDVFKASDYKISPFEVESVLIEHPAVAEAAVVPAPDAVRLAVPKAYIALAPGHEPGEDVARSILAHAREKLAPWQRVRRIEFYELPKTISGKIRRVELRGRENELESSGSAQPENEWRDDQFPD